VNDAKQNYHRLKLKARRKFRKQKKQAEEVAVQADNSLEKLVFRRIPRLGNVKRFVSVWTLLVMLIGFGAIWQVRGLDKYYLTLKPADGGIYREGIIGSFTTASPLFAVGPTDVSVSKLVFSGLFQIAPDSTLKPDIATGFNVDKKGLVYTVKLRNDVRWHDGEALTSKDVVFTYNKIKNPDAKSPLFSSWRDVNVKATDDYTVVFTLPNALASFKYSMINGIVPEHILRDTEAADLRSSLFNTDSAIGTGPFVLDSVDVKGNSVDDRQEKITLQSYDDYHKNRPKIDGVVIRTYRDDSSLIEAFKEQEITAMVGLRELPEELLSDSSIQIHSTPLLSSIMVFMNNSKPALSDKNVRRALVQATNTEDVRAGLGYQSIKVDSPFLQSHFAYDADKVQWPYDSANAAKLLDDAGWKIRENGKREKDGESLKIATCLSKFIGICDSCSKSNRNNGEKLEVEVDAILQPEEDVQSGSVSRHDYDLLLYGIAIGSDPDVFAILA